MEKMKKLKFLRKGVNNKKQNFPKLENIKTEEEKEQENLHQYITEEVLDKNNIQKNENIEKDVNKSEIN